MKPAIAILSSLLFAACVGQAPAPDGDDTTDPPPHIKQPPQPRDGGATAAGCDGVTESGKCEEGVATFCDVSAGTLRKKDCKALGKSCVVDPSRGAKCDTPTGGTGNPPPPPTGGCGSVTLAGSCTGANNQVAQFCYENSIVEWDCAGETNMSCQMDQNGILGAWCHPKPGMEPPPTTNKCPDLGIEGACDSASALSYCVGTELHQETCATGQSCQVDGTTGYALCVAAPTDPTADTSDCATIGYNGICKPATAAAPNGTLRYCTGQGTETSPYKAKEKACTTGQSCVVDAGYASCK